MKSCRCTQCNVASARYSWGFVLMARDGWGVSEEEAPATSSDGAWLCPACSARSTQVTPGVAKASTAAVPVSRRSRPRGVLRVLLVDDEDMVRRCTARALSEFEVVSVSSAAEALELLAKDSDFDVVLSDVMMPGMTGPELYGRVAQSQPALAKRFVFASGNPEAARTELMLVVSKTRASHAPILLSKPCPRAALLLALYAASAHVEPRSGTYSIGEAGLTEVKSYRG